MPEPTLAMLLIGILIRSVLTVVYAEMAKRSIIYQSSITIHPICTSRYTCQWKTADHLQKTSRIFKWTQIILSAISAGGCLAAVVTDQAQLAWIGGIVSTLLLVVSGYLKDKDFAAEQKEYRSAATKLWMIREEYISLLTDFEALDEQEIEKKREELVKKTSKIYETAPQTDSKSYKEAQNALKNKEEQFFTQQELNVMLPMHLRKDT